MVVHCAQGCHRTGVMCYLTLRHLGQGPEAALQTIFSTRQITHAEVSKAHGVQKPLTAIAESMLIL